MKKVLVVLTLSIFVASMAYAECVFCRNIKSDDITKAAGARLANGLCNATLGWSELFFRPGKVAAAGGNAVVGFFRGIGYALTRTAVGVVEVATFWTPGTTIGALEDCPICAYK